MTKVELIIIPFPATGHLLATIEFAKHLTDFDRRIQMITILSMKLPFAPHADAYTRSNAASLPSVQFIELPDVEGQPPIELLRRCPEAYIYAFVKKSIPLVAKTIRGFLSSRGLFSVRIAGLILDFFCTPLMDVTDELRLPSYIFLTSSAGFLSLMKYLPERHSIIPSEFDRNSRKELLIPGFCNPVPSQVLPPAIFNKDGYDAYVKLGERFVGAKGILVNTFAELEPHTLEYFANEPNYPPVYPIGPVLNLKGFPNPNLNAAQHEEILKWLDDQPESSVVYVSFGSMVSLGAPQVKELAHALELSGYRFLWSLQVDPANDEGPLPKGFLDRVAGRGKICRWAPQVDILAHKAVGGFMSHCGWNSILESLWYGVPVTTWPWYAEQQLNAFTMVKELGLAMEMRLDYAGGELVMRDEIARSIRYSMEGNNVVRKKVKEMTEAARKAMMAGGSSFTALERFTQQIIRSIHFFTGPKKTCLEFNFRCSLM